MSDDRISEPEIINLVSLDGEDYRAVPLAAATVCQNDTLATARARRWAIVADWYRP